jgi:hypothetical protein
MRTSATWMNECATRGVCALPHMCDVFKQRCIKCIRSTGGWLLCSFLVSYSACSPVLHRAPRVLAYATAFVMAAECLRIMPGVRRMTGQPQKMENDVVNV